MIVLKSASELRAMQEPCDVVREVLEKIEGHLRPGITTKELDKIAEGIIRSRGGVPSFLGYHGFPASTCISRNEVVVHGIPGADRLQEGDIVSIDVGVYLNGFHGDAARTFAVGEITPEARRLMTVTEESFFKGVEQMQLTNRLLDISAAVQTHAEAAGFGIVRDFFGHGIGRELHEEPGLPNFGKPNRGPRLRAGMVLALEPMVTMGDFRVKTLSDGWTAVTVDGSLAAHYENTVAITANGPVIMTL